MTRKSVMMATWSVVTLFTLYMRRLPRQPRTMALIPAAAPIAARSAPAPAGRAGGHDHRVITSERPVALW
jgi:hypothetical protein